MLSKIIVITNLSNKRSTAFDISIFIIFFHKFLEETVYYRMFSVKMTAYQKYLKGYIDN